jgi:peptidoglycan-N-acetylglucosamine deacetylase
MLSMNALEIAIPVLTAIGVPAWAGLHPRSQLFGPTISKVENGCALTFDDGPNPRVTPKLLALLEKYDVPATFFVLGKYVAEYPALTREIVAAKHTIGNHSNSHPSLLFFSQRRIMDELNLCSSSVTAATGQSTTLLRPPFGFRGPQFHSVTQRMGFSKIVMWSVSGRDWTAQPHSRVIHRIQKAKSGDIVLLHDGDHRVPNADRSHMLEALAYWLPRSQDAGLKFVRI